ncbi:cytochrome P450 [Spongisporangium articulatum]|uniref:Cytochrome P450 n=1 Tax=Spongisporangium articulatum TaxID=3362603 RepID=A0ABW8AQM0_9ACTN
MSTNLSAKARAVALQGLVAGGVAVKRVQGDPIARLVTPSGRRNPYPAYRQMRESGLVVPSMIGWVTAHHAVGNEVLRDHERFGSAPVPDVERPSTFLSRVMVRLRAGGEGNARMNGRRVTGDGLFDDTPDPLGDDSMIGMDPPDHTRLRRLVSKAFTPRAIEAVRGRVEEVADELLDAAPQRGFELMEGYAGVLPVVVISELLGIPTSDWERVKRWGDVLASGLDVMGGAPAHVVTPALNELGAYLRTLFAQRRRTGGDRVVDALIADADSEAGLTDRELVATAMLILAAGFETTVNLIGNATLAMMRNPDQVDLLREKPELAGNLVEEALRYESSVQMTARMIRKDTEIAGRRVRKGSAIVVMLGGANRDPAVFADPDRFDIARENARDHMSFAGGVHYCLGASLARLEGEVALRMLFERHPALRLDGKVERGKGLILRGPKRLPLRLS